MSTNQRMEVQQKLADTFYWAGMAMSVTCIALAWSRNTELVGRFEHASFPLSWAAGIIAILAFLAAEYCHPAPPAKERGARRAPEMLPENLPWETEFADS
jgi:hypothetical protein